jgi:putative peptidoglycan lipid II flippase
MMKEAEALSARSPSPQSAPDVPAEEVSEDVSVARATGVIALGNVASRLLGLGREMLLSDLFGAGAAVDAFNMAVIVPKTLYDLLIGGHVNSALVPVLSEYALLKDRNRLWRLVNLLLGGVVCGLAVLVLLLEILAPQIIALVSGGNLRLLLVATNLPPADVLRLMSGGALLETQRLATELLRITTPALLILSLFAVLSGLLYSLQRFTLPAFAGACSTAASCSSR